MLQLIVLPLLILQTLISFCHSILPIPFPFPTPGGKWSKSVYHAPWSNRAIKVYEGIGDKDLFDATRFLPGLETILLISGFYDDNTDYQSTLHAVLLFPALMMNNSRPANYLYLDWGQIWMEYIFPNDTAIPTEYGGLNNPASIYYNMALRIHPAAEFAARALFYLWEIGYVSGDKLHIVGHSFGAHIAGQIAVEFEKLTLGHRVARVTGLDPAGVLDPWPTQAGAQLSYRDAEYVDVYYTNMQLFGMKNFLNVHMSYVVNDGTQHEACGDDGLPYWKQLCNHVYAVPVFIEASRTDTPVRGCSCLQHVFPFDVNQFEACSHYCPDPVVAGAYSDRPTGFRSIYLPLSPTVVKACMNERYFRGGKNFMFLIQCFNESYK